MDDKEKGTLFFLRLDGLLGGCGALFRQAPSAGSPCRASGSRAPLKEEEGTLFFRVALMISPWLCVSVRKTIERGDQPDASGAGCLCRSTAEKVSHGGTETRRWMTRRRAHFSFRVAPRALRRTSSSSSAPGPVSPDHRPAVAFGARRASAPARRPAAATVDRVTRTVSATSGRLGGLLGGYGALLREAIPGGAPHGVVLVETRKLAAQHRVLHARRCARSRAQGGPRIAGPAMHEKGRTGGWRVSGAAGAVPGARRSLPGSTCDATSSAAPGIRHARCGESRLEKGHCASVRRSLVVVLH
jgi:hypothetical protein